MPRLFIRMCGNLLAGLYTSTAKHVIIENMRQFLFSLHVDALYLPYQAHCVLRTTIERYLLAAG